MMWRLIWILIVLFLLLNFCYRGKPLYLHLLPIMEKKLENVSPEKSFPSRVQNSSKSGKKHEYEFNEKDRQKIKEIIEKKTKGE